MKAIFDLLPKISPQKRTTQTHGGNVTQVDSRRNFANLLTIYAPMIYTAPCVRFWIWADRLRGEVGGRGWRWKSRVLWAL